MTRSRKIAVALAAATSCLAAVTSAVVLLENAGQPAVPLDDAYIHFQFARGFAEGRPLSYSPGSDAVPGATSLLWPLLLAPFLALGVGGSAIIWVAWAFGWLSLGLLGFETWRAAAPLVSAPIALATAAMTLSFGGYAWFAASGMEVVPLSFLLLRAVRRAADFAEGDAGRRCRIELVALALLGPLLRPEGALASILIAVTLFTFRQRAAHWWPFLALLGPGLPALFNFCVSGQALSTTAQVKWLIQNPYYDFPALIEQVGKNIGLLFSTLLDGRLWSAVFLPQGSGPVAWLALPALAYASVASKHRFRAGLLLVLALGMFIPTTYDSFLWNRLRYLWPFAAPWFVGLGISAQLLGQIGSRYRSRLSLIGPVGATAIVILLLTELPQSVRDLAQSARAISRQQVSLGHWAKHNLPHDSLIGINDAGAITYYSGQRTFDIVGLTTRGEARYWVAGAGSRFEHYESLSLRALPTHFIVYAEWMALPPLLGRLLTERSVPGATILGGTTMTAHAADYTTLGSGALPKNAPQAPLIDVLDVADLQSEADHDYRLLDASQRNNFIAYTLDGQRADGARGARQRDVFDLRVRGGGTLALRAGASQPMSLRVMVADKVIGSVRLSAGAWQEAALTLPARITAQRTTVVVEAPAGKHFASMHYWSFGRHE